MGLRHAMGAKYESCSVIGHRIRRGAYSVDLDAGLQGDDLDGPGANSSKTAKTGTVWLNPEANDLRLTPA